MSIGEGKVDEMPVDEIKVGANNLTCVLENLESFTVYKIEVLGFTYKGDGPPAMTFAGKLAPLEAISVLMLCAPSNCRRPFLYHTKMADLWSLFVFCSFSGEKIDISSEKCIEYVE